MTPPARLTSTSHRDFTNLLVVGGTADERIQVAYEFHRESMLRSGPFICVDGAREQHRLRRALEQWISIGGRQPWGDLLAGAQHGMMFIDSIICLPRDLQRLLLGFVRRFVNAPPEQHAEPWVGRLAAGDRIDPLIAVENGSFCPSLHDCLDKVRVELPQFHLRYGS